MSVLPSGLVILQRKPWRPEWESYLPEAAKLSQSGRNGSTLALLGLNLASWPLSQTMLCASLPSPPGNAQRSTVPSRTGKWGQ